MQLFMAVFDIGRGAKKMCKKITFQCRTDVEHEMGGQKT